MKYSSSAYKYQMYFFCILHFLRFIKKHNKMYFIAVNFSTTLKDKSKHVVAN
jgi:hypothetical protein